MPRKENFSCPGNGKKDKMQKGGNKKNKKNIRDQKEIEARHHDQIMKN